MMTEAMILPARLDEASGFDEPWQARAFGIVNLLVRQGTLTASSWSNCLGSKRAVDSDIDQGYWRDWLETVEDFLSEQGILAESHIGSAMEMILDAREHRHAAAPDPIAIDPACRKDGV